MWNPVREKFNQFVETTKALCNPEESDETRDAARHLLPVICDLSVICFAFFWADILGEVNLAQKYVQTPGITLDVLATKLSSLSSENIFGRAVQQRC